MGDIRVIDSGYCYRMHIAGPIGVDCLGSFVSLVEGFVCFCSFGYVLYKMIKNHRRALAGYTRNTVNIDSHVNIVGLVALWSIIWFIQKVFDVNDNVSAKEDDDRSFKDDPQSHGMTILSSIATRGLECFLEMAVVLLICKRSVGQEAIDRLWSSAGAITGVFSLCIICIAIFAHGPRSDYWPPYRNLQVLYNVFNVFCLVVYSFAVYYCRETGISTGRPDGTRFLRYMLWMTAIFVATGVLLVMDQKVPVNLGICGWDLINIFKFATFAPWIYFVLKRDCQYWGLDVEGNEEEVSLLQTTDDVAWEEGISYQDIVIPKTAIYFRKKLEEHFDTIVDLCFWRRRLVVVKKFQFDFLSRENIKCFKQEANIFRKLKHPNIVQFFGVVIDPPSLGIVMQYAVNGDLFKYLENKRGVIRKSRMSGDKRGQTNSSDIGSFASNNANGGAVIDFEEHNDTEPQKTFSISSVSQRIGALFSFKKHGDPAEVAQIQSSAPNSRGSSTDRVGSMIFSGTPTNDRFGFRSSLVNLAAGIPAMGPQPFHPIRCATQVAKGMSYLHIHDILHRDLKSLNVLLDDHYTARIADFGESVFVAPVSTDSQTSSALSSGAHTNSSSNSSFTFGRKPVRKVMSRLFSSSTATVVGTAPIAAALAPTKNQFDRVTVGTPGWGAPEALMGVGSSRLSDVFGFGVILWELLTWRPPSVLVSREVLQDVNLCKALGLKMSQNAAAGRVHGTPTSVHGGSAVGELSSQPYVEGASSAGSTANPMLMASDNTELDVEADGGSKFVTNSSGRSKHITPSKLTEQPTRLELRDLSTDSNAPAGLIDRNSLGASAATAAATTHGAFPTQRSDGLLLVEISSMVRAVELMCDRKLRPPIPLGLPSDLALLLSRCWHFDPAKRPDFPEIISILEEMQSHGNLMVQTTKHFSLKGSAICISTEEFPHLDTV